MRRIMCLKSLLNCRKYRFKYTVANLTHVFRVCLGVLVLLILSRCGVQPGGGGGAGVRVEISPSLLTLKPGQTAQIRARQTFVEEDDQGQKVLVAESSPEAFDWELEGDAEDAVLLVDRGRGCMVFGAPPRAGTIRVVARSRRESEAFDRMTITVEEKSQ